jgi:hypothetical protein
MNGSIRPALYTALLCGKSNDSALAINCKLLATVAARCSVKYGQTIGEAA